MKCRYERCCFCVQLRLMCQVNNRAEVTLLPPYVPSDAERRDARLFAGNVRRLFADTLKLPLVDQASRRCTLCCRLP